MTEGREFLLERLQYRFRDTNLLDEALTHRSVCERNNERLEFLGDSILNFVIASELYARGPEDSEGALSRLRASLVNRGTLADIARNLELGKYLQLGSGELKSGGRRRDSILADALESLLGAVYQDGGYDDCRALILRLFEDRLESLPCAHDLKDPKTRLQEHLQSIRRPLPTYQVTDVSGKAHEQTFSVECSVEGLDTVTNGKAANRRRAEQAAASAMLDALQPSRRRKES
ncbi:MAG: ribonuclease III [Aquisalimonadaceae bacterium]